MALAKQPHAAIIATFLALFWAGQATATTPLFDGDFESGTLQGWTPAGSGSAIVASRGTCFSDYDTTAVSIRGRFAGLLRSDKNATAAALPSLTSKPFIAGRGVVFLALSEQRGDLPKEHPFALNVSILDAAGSTLRTFPLATALAKLTGGCPSLTGDASFGQHFVNTHQFAGQQIRLQFTHHLDLAKSGAFTLIDNIAIIDSDETPVFQSYPIAKAGFEFSNSHLFLTAENPDGDLAQTQSWQYSWLINGEGSRRPYYNPCIDDLEPGDYTANLYVRQYDRLVTDTLHFSVPYIIYSTTSVETGETTSSTTSESSSDPTCNYQHPLDLEEASDSTTDGGTGTGTDENTRPAIDLTLTESFTAGIATILISDITISSDDNLASASLSLSNPQTGDILTPPADADLLGLTLSSCTTTSCTLSGDANSNTYQAVLGLFEMTLADSAEVRTVNLSVTDSGSLSSTAAGTITVEGATSPPEVTAFSLATITVSELTTLISTLSISADNDLSTAELSIVSAQAGDSLSLAADVDLKGLSPSCSGASCTLSGEASAADYESVFEQVSITLDTTDLRYIKIKVTDTLDQTNGDSAIEPLTPIE